MTWRFVGFCYSGIKISGLIMLGVCDLWVSVPAGHSHMGTMVIMEIMAPIKSLAGFLRDRQEPFCPAHRLT